MFAFGAGTEEERVAGREVEGCWVGEDGYAQGVEEGLVQLVEDGVLGVDGE